MEDLKKENMILRELLWLYHGHSPRHLYGDDGQMQCHKCFGEFGFFDWKNTPAEEIRSKIQESNYVKANADVAQR